MFFLVLQLKSLCDKNKQMRKNLDLGTFLQKPFPLMCIAGATATGKSGLALEIAKKYNGVIINADSQQVYQGLPLLTAQPSLNEQREISHKLYQYVPNKEPKRDVKQWIQDAIKEIHECHDAGYLPILVGGSGFYFQALEQGLSPFPPIEPLDESELLKKYPNYSLYEILDYVDSISAKKIMKQDKQRILRALRVYFSTKIPLSYWQKSPKTRPLSYCCWYKIYIFGEKFLLQKRIRERFDQACRNGLLQEVFEFSLTPDSPLSRAIGIKILKSWERGEFSWKETQEKFLTETWQYAKRQKTWFQHRFIPDKKIILE
ncbi:tRNA dimethylallyltransferase [Holospora undulata HU1]|uniref:tRNA dimethylallyltransferase n=1 Tax=Holospora undulata HU1 TaxID=1321371 RepID=A0A061JI33_9PROT|nr:tRNA dimethylallyltransferase [Holospora undulata HU1]